MTGIAGLGPLLRRVILLQAFECLLSFDVVLAEALHCSQRVLQVRLDAVNQIVIPLDLLRQQCIERFLSFDWNLLFVLFRFDLGGDLEEDLLKLRPEVLIDLSVPPIGLHLGQRGLLGPLDDELVDVSSMHDC